MARDRDSAKGRDVIDRGRVGRVVEKAAEASRPFTGHEGDRAKAGDSRLAEHNQSIDRRNGGRG